MKHILIVDDDIHIGNLLQEALEAEGYRASRAYSGTEAVLALDRGRPDLILLDLMLPGLSGEEVLPRLAGVPVIVVSAKADIDSKTALLLGGAADYVTKPFVLRELLARVAVRLREEHPAHQGGAMAFGPLRLEPDARCVSVDGAEARLTRTEYAILKLLLENPSQVVTKSRLLDEVGQDTPDCTESSLKTHMSNLRRKLREAGAGDCIHTPEQLVREGAEQTFFRLKTWFPQVCLVHLYALEGAIRGVEFNRLPTDRKRELKAFSDQLK